MRSRTESTSSTGDSRRSRISCAAAARDNSYGCIVLLLFRTEGTGGRGVTEVQLAQDPDDGVDVVGGGRDHAVAVIGQRKPGTGGPAGGLGRCESGGGHGFSPDRA